MSDDKHTFLGVPQGTNQAYDIAFGMTKVAREARGADAPTRAAAVDRVVSDAHIAPNDLAELISSGSRMAKELLRSLEAIDAVDAVAAAEPVVGNALRDLSRSVEATREGGMSR